MAGAANKPPSSEQESGEFHEGSARPPANRGLVILVDDDAAVRDAVATALRTTGFTVLTFGSARQLLDGHRAGSRGCLVVDFDLPEIEVELLRELSLPTIVTSRRLRQRALARALAPLSVMLLEKPFGIDELLPLVRAALAGGRRA